MKILTKADLQQFTGTTQYYKHGVGPLFIYLTDGTKFLAEQAGCYWLMDIILSYKTHPKVKREEFQVWTLQKRKDDWIVSCSDVNEKMLITQIIHYSDFPFDFIQLYFSDNICLLPWEY